MSISCQLKGTKDLPCQTRTNNGCQDKPKEATLQAVYSSVEMNIGRDEEDPKPPLVA
jgi:hypothetical protein